MKIYLASRYSRLDEMTTYGRLLQEDGHEITSTWIWGNEEGLSNDAIADLDYNDVIRADAVIGFTDPYGSSHTGGARHFELGLAVGVGKATYIVGEREIVFHHLPEVHQYDSFEQVRAQLKNYV